MYNVYHMFQFTHLFLNKQYRPKYIVVFCYGFAPVTFTQILHIYFIAKRAVPSYDHPDSSEATLPNMAEWVS